MNSSPPPYAPSPPSDNLPPIPSITGVQPVAPPLQFTIRAPVAPTPIAMPQVRPPTVSQTLVPVAQYQASAQLPGSTQVLSTQYQAPVPGQTVQYRVPYQAPVPGQTVQYRVPYQAPTTTLQLQPLAPSVPGMISAPQIGLQKLRIEPYTEKSFIVRGETKPYRTPLKMMKGKWINKPRDNREPGWMFGNYGRPEVEAYVQSVNNGTAKPPPTYQVQTVSWSIFKPEEGMKLKITIPTGVTDYTVASIEKEGWMVIKATVFCPQQPSSVHQIAIISGKWQIMGYNEKHTIEPAV